MRGGYDRRSGTRSSFAAEAKWLAASEEVDSNPSHGNTTLTVLVTNRRPAQRSLRQLGRQVHASMARAIQPFHTPYDGDVFSAVSAAEVADEEIDEITLGVVASEVAWDAVLASFEASE